ncbi:MAG: trigger factor [Actinobacteria bacterium]|nr:trigger factor [Actinomycetota bacterium]
MSSPEVATERESVDKDRIKLRVEVPEAALDPALTAVYRRWSQEIKVPGFRRGKVPRRLIDQRVGIEAVRDEALKDALPGFYQQALEAESLEAIAPPEVNIVDFTVGTPLVFEATVDVRPEVVVPELGNLRIEAPDSEVRPHDIDEQIDRLRDRFAELENVGREARRGDFVLLDLNAYQHDEVIEEASATGYLYEIGSREGPPSLDEELEGTRPGAILRFTDRMGAGAGELADQDVSFTVLIKEVKTKRLPAADDEFAKTAGEFDTIAELRDAIKDQLKETKRARAREELRGAVLEALIDASDLEAPSRLVEDEFTHRLEHLEEELSDAGMTLSRYATEIDSTELEVRSDLRRGSGRAVKGELLLEQIAREQNVQVSDEELGRQVAYLAARAGREPRDVAQSLADSGQLGSVAADIMRRKALEYATEQANVIGLVTDEEDQPENEQTNEDEQIVEDQ